MTDERVVVVGGGLAGAATARELASTHEVTLLERDAVAAGATGRSAGLVAPTLFYGDWPALARHVVEEFRAFDGTGAFAFTERPRIDVVDDGDVEAERRRAAKLAKEGFPVRYVDATAVAEEFPAIDLDPFPGAVRYGDTGWVDPYTYAVTLLEEATDRGVRVETGVEVAGVEAVDGAVTAVETADGPVEADRVVVAAGWRTPELLPVELPVQPYRTQCVTVEPERPLDADFPLGRISSAELYFRPEHGGTLLVGGGAHTCPDPVAAADRADESFVRSVAEFLPRHLVGFENAGIADDWAGFDAATPDARPIVGRPPGAPEGLVVATGFNGLGVMITPAIGPTVREALGGEPAPFPTDVFDPARFDGATGFDLRTTADV